jgi:hypothetical protein
MPTFLSRRCGMQDCCAFEWGGLAGGGFTLQAGSKWDQLHAPCESEFSGWIASEPTSWNDLRETAERLAIHLAGSRKTQGRIETLEREIACVKAQVAEIQKSRSIQVPINTFAPMPFEPTKPISVLVEPVSDESGEPCEYIATFVDGVVSATGDTIEDAVAMLKDRMVGQLKSLGKAAPASLGMIPRQQLAALQSVMRAI